MSEEPHVSLTAWLTPASLSEKRLRNEPLVGTLHVTIPHGKTRRMIPVNVTLDECLALCANAADAARLLAREDSRGQH
jgi:hypothetical protein